MNPPQHPIGGTYFRVTDPDWADPLDASFAASSGGRWNPADGAPGVPLGGVQTMYLNADLATARANARAKFRGLPYGPEDLDPASAPVLVDVELPDGEAWDLRSDAGLTAVGLPSTYPLGASGDEIGWNVCQPIGFEAWQADSDGVACRSAADGGREELAWFVRGRLATASASRSFDEWYWT